MELAIGSSYGKQGLRTTAARVTPDADPARYAERMASALQTRGDGLAACLDLIDDPGLQLATGDELMEWARRIEEFGNRAPVAGQQLINAMSASGCRTDSPLGLYATMPAFLASLLGISRAEANRRFLLAEALAPTGRSG